MRQSKAQARFAQAADQLQNLVYEQAESLAPVEKALEVKVNATPFVSRAQVQQLALGNAKFVQSLFSPESIQGKRNTEAIEVGPNALMAGRIVEYKPAAPRPFDEVKDEIRRQLARPRRFRARAEGRARKARAARAGKEREGGRRCVRQAGVAAARPAAAGLHARCRHARLPGGSGEAAEIHRRDERARRLLDLQAGRRDDAADRRSEARWRPRARDLASSSAASWSTPMWRASSRVRR